MKLVFLGNSITHHAPAAELGWHGDWGMAASAPENDYVHQTARLLEAAGRTVDYLERCIAELEREPETYDLAAVSDLIGFAPDLLVVRLGENVPGDKHAAFLTALEALLRRFTEAAVPPRVFLTGLFWRNDALEEGLRSLAQKLNAVFVDLTQIQGEAYQAIGAYAHAGVAAHPSDRGMLAIAKALVAAMDAAGQIHTAAAAPFPAGEPEYEGYTVLINGARTPCYTARVSAMPFNRVWPGHQRPKKQTELSAFLSFEMSAPTDLAVQTDVVPEDVVIRPLSKNVIPTVCGNVITFTLRTPGQYSLEVNGRRHNLHIFADRKAPDCLPPASATYYFGPGVHRCPRIVLRTGESLYIAPGAVLYSEVESTDAENVTVFGGGILCGSLVDRQENECDMRSEGLVHFTRCRRVRMEGVTLRDPCMWTVTAINCRDVEFENVKVVGLWRYNADGFDFVNSQDVTVRGCFLRTFDDTIVLKGLCLGDRSIEKMDPERYLISDCVLWCDWGGALEIGAETVADRYRDILFRNCDIIRTDSGAMRIHSGDRADIGFVSYRDIRVEYSKYDAPSQLQEDDDMRYSPREPVAHDDVIKIWMYCGVWSPDNIPGHVHDVIYQDIRVYTDEEVPAPGVSIFGKDEAHTADNIRIENYRLNGEKTVPAIRINDVTGKITLA